MRPAAVTLAPLMLAFLVVDLTACSKQPKAGEPSTGAAAAGDTAASANSACDRQILRLEDLAGILNAPITRTSPLPGDPQSCEFLTAVNS